MSTSYAQIDINFHVRASETSTVRIVFSISENLNKHRINGYRMRYCRCIKELFFLEKLFSFFYPVNLSKNYGYEDILR